MCSLDCRLCLCVFSVFPSFYLSVCVSFLLYISFFLPSSLLSFLPLRLSLCLCPLSIRSSSLVSGCPLSPSPATPPPAASSAIVPSGGCGEVHFSREGSRGMHWMSLVWRGAEPETNKANFGSTRQGGTGWPGSLACGLSRCILNVAFLCVYVSSHFCGV